MTILLHCHPFSPYSQKVLVALYERGIAFRKKVIGARESKPRAKLRTFAPITRCPVLFDAANGRTIRDAGAILRHLDRLPSDSRRLVPRTRDRADAALAWERFFDGELVEPALKILGDKFRPEGARDSHGVEEARRTLVKAYRKLNWTLRNKGSGWAAGRTFSIADCAAGPALYFGNLACPVKGEWLKAYYGRLRKRPSFARAVNEARPYRKSFSPRWTRILRRLLPTSWSGCLAAMAGGLSISALVAKTYDQNLSSALGVIINYYDNLVGALASLLTGPIQTVLSWMRIEITLGAIWAHVAVLCGIYLLRNVVRLSTTGRYPAALYQLPWAVFVMLFAGIGADWIYSSRPEAGLDPKLLQLLGNSSPPATPFPALFYTLAPLLDLFISQELPSAAFVKAVSVNMFPIAGLFIMLTAQGVWFASHPKDRRYRTWPDFGGSWLYFVAMQMWYALRLVMGGMVLTLVFTWLFMAGGLERPAIAVLLVLVISLAIYWMAVGWGTVRKEGALTTRHGFPWTMQLGQMLDTQAGKLGVVMLHTILVFLIFLLSNAGLGERGL